MKEIITSSKNQQLKNISALLKSKKERDEQGVFITEGIRIFRDTMSSAAGLVEKIYYSESYASELNKNGQIIQDDNTEVVKDSVFEAISGTVSPQGVLCIVRKPEYSLEALLNAETAKYLLLEDIQDPGNLGTMIRTAEAAGVKAVIMSSGCADIFNPKVVRATMGSIFRVPFVYVPDFTGTIGLLKEKGVAVYAAYLHGGRPYREVQFAEKHAILIGNEGNGLTEEAVRAATHRVYIPMQGQIESLNAAVAAAILMYN